MNRKDPKWDLKSFFYRDLFEACMGLWSMEFGALISRNRKYIFEFKNFFETSYRTEELTDSQISQKIQSATRKIYQPFSSLVSECPLTPLTASTSSLPHPPAPNLILCKAVLVHSFESGTTTSAPGACPSSSPP